MKFLTTALLFATISTQQRSVSACPYSNIDNDIPDDATHSHLRRRRLASLTEDKTTRANIALIISDKKRFVQGTCFSRAMYEDIYVKLEAIANAIVDSGDRGHFIGGIVRLAAHDFMDFDLNAADQLGSDGCITFGDDANAGLSDLWCDTCAFKELYDVNYSGSMSRADFWVAAANAVIKLASPRQTLELPFRYGRVDTEDCPNSSSRLPEPTGCDEVKQTFIDRMGLTWTDAVALMGAHTLGRGAAEFSGHPGTWVRNDDESVIFDRGFYLELLRRGWRSREGLDDWTWGNDDEFTRMMLHSDVCLGFDIDENKNCCTNTDANCNDNRDPLGQCPTSEIVRKESFDAVHEFAAVTLDGREANDAFFNAFSVAWESATENGYDTLSELCDDNDDCADVDTFVDRQGRTQDCAWVARRDKCGKYSAECPVTCDACP